MSELRVVVVPVGRVPLDEIEGALSRVVKVINRPIELREAAPIPRGAEDASRRQYRTAPFLAEVRRAVSVPIATGENLHTVYEFRRMIAHGGIAYPEPDVANIGGITPWLEVARLAEEKDLPVTTHGVHDLQVHLLAAAPNASYLEVHGFGLDRFMAHPLVIEDGMARAPDRAGHGVELDWDSLEPHRASHQ